MIKICLLPDASKVRDNNGIGRVVHAQLRDLPARGFEFVDEHDADLYIGHTQQFNMPRIDALICHGMYWTGDADSGKYSGYSNSANREIVNAARRARVITTPSEWVAMPFKRDMRINPVVIGHGIDVADWQIGTPQGYALWNKNRNFDVCNPIAAWELAKRGVEVMATFLPEKMQRPKTMQIIGVQTSAAMHDIISRASIYLSTVKETWGISTVEAMACGVPVLGWDYGGTAEIVTNGVEGVLVHPGDYDALYEGYKTIMANRERMSAAARQKALRYDWSVAMDQYADLFRQLHEAVRDEPKGISVVITSYNYGRYVEQAIDSALNQTRKPDEVIVVDDGSTDDTLARIATRRYRNVRVITQENRGVAAARTAGISACTQPFVTLLDADDVLEPTFLDVLHREMIADRGLGIAYTGLIGFRDDGSTWETDFPPAFTWNQQAQNTNPPANCIPSACLFRRDMWLRAGPHKQEYAPGEDAEFWTRGLSVGFTAKRVTTDRLFRYRLHTGSATRTKTYKPIDDRLPWLRDHRFPFAVPMQDDKVPEIRSYSEPVVSVVIAVTPGHAAKLSNAIDSVLGQTLREWELIVVDGTHDPRALTTQIDPLVIRRYPFALWLIGGASKNGARNLGLAEARAPLILALEPDDELMPDALHRLLTGYVESEGRFSYGDTYILTPQRDKERITFKQWPGLVQTDAQRARIAALIPRDWLVSLGGWDESTQDDGDLYARMARKGYCGWHVERVSLVQTHLNGYKTGHKVTVLEDSEMGGCCGGNANAILEAKKAISGMPQDINTYAGDRVGGIIRMEYTGSNVGSYTYNGRAGRTYRGGNNDAERYAFVHPDDVEVLAKTSKWIVSPIPTPIKNEPEKTPEPTPAIAPEPMLEQVKAVEPDPVLQAAPAIEANLIIEAPKPKAKRGRGK